MEIKATIRCVLPGSEPLTYHGWVRYRMPTKFHCGTGRPGYFLKNAFDADACRQTDCVCAIVLLYPPGDWRIFMFSC